MRWLRPAAAALRRRGEGLSRVAGRVAPTPAPLSLACRSLSPLPRRYLPLVEAIQANMAGSGKDVYVTVLEGCGQRKILSQFLLK